MARRFLTTSFLAPVCGVKLLGLVIGLKARDPICVAPFEWEGDEFNPAAPVGDFESVFFWGNVYIFSTAMGCWVEVQGDEVGG